MSYYQINSPLILSGDPEHPMHAVTKQYVDARTGMVDGARYQTGTLGVDKLPALRGDVASDEGTNVLRLADSGVTAGEYFRVDVDSKGRVVGGDTSHHSEGREISWSWVIGKPTSLAGFGITDVVSTNGGTVSAKLSSSVAATGANHAVTKGKVDEIINNINVTAAETGDIVRVASSETPSGFLRANGGVLDKTTYAALYAVIGDTFNTGDGGFGFMGQPWRQQYAFNTEDNGANLVWTTGKSLPGGVHYSQAVVTRNRVYLLGGRVNSTESSTVYTAPILADGTLGTWTTGTPLPSSCCAAQAIITRSRVYFLGGYPGTTTVYTAPILADGTLGNWDTAEPLPSYAYDSQIVVTRSNIYLIGGNIGSSNVYIAPILSDGTLGSWTAGPTLPVTVAYSQAIVTKNRVYLLGGYNSSTVYTAPILSDGTLGSWTTGVSLPDIVYNSQAVVTRNRVYLLGGISSGVIYTAPILADGTLGSWTTGGTLPGGVQNSQAIVTRSRVYLLGGNNGSSSSTVYTAPFSGGTNDYLTLIANNTIDSSTQFKLPDYTSKETDGLFYYIKA